MMIDTMEDAVYIAMLHQISGVGPQSILCIIKEFPSADLFHQASSNELTEKLGKRLASLLSLHPEEWSHHQEIARKKLLETVAQNIIIIPLTSPFYPPLLKLIHDPPVLLYAKGNIDLLQQTKSVAIVGTRNPTPKGREMAFSFSQYWAKYDYVIVSGLAKGIDAEAHRAAMEVEGKTIAVMGTPLDKIYPAEHKELAQRILDKGGLWLSEMALGQTSAKSGFVQRDRIQSGLSLCVFPVQTTRDGGTMHAVRFADEQKRYVICLQPPLSEEHEKQYDGIWYLIRERKKACLDITRIEHYERCKQRFNQLEQKLLLEGSVPIKPEEGTMHSREAKAVDIESNDLWVINKASQMYQVKSSIGKTIGNYRIIEKIAKGGYGTSYKAVHTSVIRRTVAIKIFKDSLYEIKEKDQFAQATEKFLFKLNHPYILPMLDSGFVEHQPYIILPYIISGSLRKLIKWPTRLPFDQVLMILVQVGQALDYAHQQNIVHGDLKPENIFFDEQKNVLLADFRVMFSNSKVRQVLIPDDIPYYMAPEQFNGYASPKSDQYGLGCLAYELVTGRPPFNALDAKSMIIKHQTERPILPTHYNPQVPRDVERAILKALAKEQADRYPDIPTFLTDLQASQKAKIGWPEVTSTTFTQRTGPLHSFLENLKERRRLQSREEHSAEAFIADVKHSIEASIASGEAITSEHGAQFYNAKGLALYNLHRYEEALAAYEQAILIDSNAADIYKNQGNALYKLHRYEEALTAYEQTIRIDPYNTDAYNNKSIILREIQRHEEASIAIEQFIHIYLDKAREYYNQGKSFSDFQRYEEALDSYKKALMMANTILNEYEGTNQSATQREAEEHTLSPFNEDYPVTSNNAEV